MKNYIIGVLVVIILVLSSLLYRQNQTTIPKRFPPLKEAATAKTEVPLVLYIFFKKNNCRDCLEVMQSLNDLPPHFLVVGIVPQKDLEDEKELRSITGAEFPIRGPAGLERYVPWYTPSIVGASPVTGEIIFTLPGVPGSKQYVFNFLESLYEKAYPVFLQEREANKNYANR